MNSNINVYFEVLIDGRVVIRKRRSRSFVKGFANLLWLWLSAGNNSNTQVPTDGTAAVAPTLNTAVWDSTGVVDTSTKGIVVGTNNTAVTSADTKLNTPIVTGGGAGQLRYLTQSFNNFVVNASTVTFQLTRTFINNSGGTITVKELGLYSQATAGKLFCTIRDIIVDPGVDVPAGKTLTVTYTWTIPA